MKPQRLAARLCIEQMLLLWHLADALGFEGGLPVETEPLDELTKRCQLG
jgi:hypothetical protein